MRGQAGFFDIDKRMKEIAAKGNDLEQLDAFVEREALRIDLAMAVPIFGYKDHIGVDRPHHLIRTWMVTNAARQDGVQLPNLTLKANTASEVWAERTVARKKGPIGAVLRSIGLRRAPMEIELANIAYYERRSVWLTTKRPAVA